MRSVGMGVVVMCYVDVMLALTYVNEDANGVKRCWYR